MRSSVRSRPAPLPIDAGETPSSPPAPNASSAHTSPTPREEDPATALLQRAIDGYTACPRTERRKPCQCSTCQFAGRTLGEAWRLIAPEALATIRGRVKELDRQDDALQLAFLKLWQAVRNYDHAKGPVVSAAALARWAADKTALNVVEKRDRIAEREAGGGALDDETVRDLIEYRATQLGAAIDDDRSLEEFADYAAHKAGGGRKGAIWQSIILAVAEGHVERSTIAEFVSQRVNQLHPIEIEPERSEVVVHQTSMFGDDVAIYTTPPPARRQPTAEIPEVSIRREIFHMVRVLDLRALDGIEVMRDWRTALDPTSDTSALFDYEYQEIS